jgi:hypothetical protein
MTPGFVIRLLLGGLIASVGVGCAQSRWTDLGSTEDLAAAFNRDVGNTRIVLLLSPT